MTTRSALGALAYNTGGLIVDHGWLRILGGGEGDLHSLADANGLGDATHDSTSPGLLVVAEDILGGRFAIDGGALGVEPGKVCYFGPDTLEWTGLGVGHGDFVEQMLSGATVEFYADLRWAGWEAETAALEFDQGLSVYPPPFSVEGRDLATGSRSPVPHRELVGFLDEAAQQIP